MSLGRIVEKFVENARPLVLWFFASWVVFISGIVSIRVVHVPEDAKWLFRAAGPAVFGIVLLIGAYRKQVFQQKWMWLVAILVIVALSTLVGLWKIDTEFQFDTRPVIDLSEVTDALASIMGQLNVNARKTDELFDVLASLHPPTLAPTEEPTELPTEEPEPSPSPPVGMVEIPGGTYIVGTGDLGPYSNAFPRHEHEVQTYWIHQYEVSNQDYAACTDAGKCAGLTSTGSFNRRNYYRNSEFDDFPVVWVAFKQAKTYCEDYITGFLPTEFEWEIAARGRDDWPYPWDSEEILASDANLANLDLEGIKVDTSQRGAFTRDISDFGMYDAAGNVSEWTSSWYTPYPQGNLPLSGDERVIRGGNFSHHFEDNFARVYQRQHWNPDYGYPSIGFRCAWRPPG